MPARTPRTPSYRLHKPTGQAVVTIRGRDLYLGKFGSPESKAEYDRLVAEWLANGRAFAPRPRSDPGGSPAPSDLTVSELVLAYFRFAEGYYRKNGRPTSEVVNIKGSLRPLRRLYGHTRARDFGPLALKVVRQSMIDAGLCRNEVNKRTRRVVRCFGWAVENEILPAHLAYVHHALKAVKGLKVGRSEARESDPVKPVPDDRVDAVRPHVARQVWAMVELQRLTGMRPGEATAMRTRDVDRSGPVWAYVPAGHKTEHHGKRRTVFLGPRAQEVLRPWLRADPDANLFSPAEAEAERKAAMRARRKTPVQPSQRDRRKARPARTPGPRYDTHAYYYAIRRGCARAGVEPWHPNQLRHVAATRLRAQYGLDATRAILGHSSPVVTEVYAEVDEAKAREVMGRVG